MVMMIMLIVEATKSDKEDDWGNERENKINDDDWDNGVDDYLIKPQS